MGRVDCHARGRGGVRRGRTYPGGGAWRRERQADAGEHHEYADWSLALLRARRGKRALHYADLSLPKPDHYLQVP